MKRIKVALSVMLMVVLMVSCSSESKGLQNEVLSDYELKQIELTFPSIDVINITALDIFEDVLYYKEGTGFEKSRAQNIVYSVDLEGTVKEVLKLDEDETISSFIIHNGDYYYTSYTDFTKKQSDFLFPMAYQVAKVRNDESKILLQGAVPYIDEIPRLSLVNDHIYSIVSKVTAVNYAEINKPGYYLYDLGDEEFVYTINDDQPIDYMEDDLRYKFNNAGISNLNTKVIFSLVDGIDDNNEIISRTFIYEKDKMIENEMIGVYLDNFMTLDQKIVYGIGHDYGGPYNLIYNVSENNDFKSAGVTDDEFYDVKKVIDFKDGIIVSESSHHNTQGDKTYYIEADQNDMIHKTEVSLFSKRLDAMSTITLPHGFIAISGVNEGTINIEFLSEK